MTDAEMMQALLNGKTAVHPDGIECRLNQENVLCWTWKGSNSSSECFKMPTLEGGWKIKKRTVYVNLWVVNLTRHGSFYDTEQEARRGTLPNTSEYIAIAVPVEIDV